MSDCRVCGTIAIVGSNGRLGRALVRNLSRDHGVLEISRDSLCLGAPEKFEELIEGGHVSIAIIAAAMTAVDYCEANAGEAYSVNAEGPRKIASICRQRGIRVVYIGTDFVFDGCREAPYREEDEVKPISVYGASKAKGEEYVLLESAENLVVRVSWLYGAERPAFPEWIIQQAMEKSSLSLPSEKTGSPTCAEDVAEYLRPLLGLGGSPAASGVVHLCNSGSCTWQEWGQFCLDTALEAGLELRAPKIVENRLEDIVAFVAPRPVNSVLDNSKYQRLTGIVPRSWQCALRDHLLMKYWKRDQEQVQ